MRRKVVVSYAINGRGVGHLVRQLSLLRWMRRISTAADTHLECWVITSSEADTLARREGICALKMPSKSMMRDAGLEPARYLAVARAWVLQTVAMLSPDLLLVDTFPGGSFGELVSVLELARKRALVARRVREDFASEDPYRALLSMYDLVVEPDEQGAPVLLRDREELPSRISARAALGVPGETPAILVTLGGGGDPTARATLPALLDPLLQRGWHAVVAAGPLYQGPERRGAGITWLDRYAMMELLPGIDVAISAGGYNSYHELLYTGVPAVFLPQAKLADDQEARVRQAIAAGAGEGVTAIGGVADAVQRLLDRGEQASAAARALVPRNGAHALATELLSAVLPPEDLAAAAASFSPSLYGHAAARELPPERLVELIRALSEPPSAHARATAALLSLSDRGIAVPAQPSREVLPAEAILERIDRCAVPAEPAARLLLDIVRRFPAARKAELPEVAERLWLALRRFDDWPGAIALIRALPVQRGLPIAPVIEQLCDWLSIEDDLFEAQRALVRLEGMGQRPLGEVLRLLRQRPREEQPLFGAQR